MNKIIIGILLITASGCLQAQSSKLFLNISGGTTLPFKSESDQVSYGLGHNISLNAGYILNNVSAVRVTTSLNYFSKERNPSVPSLVEDKFYSISGDYMYGSFQTARTWYYNSFIGAGYMKAYRDIQVNAEREERRYEKLNGSHFVMKLGGELGYKIVDKASVYTDIDYTKIFENKVTRQNEFNAEQFLLNLRLGFRILL